MVKFKLGFKNTWGKLVKEMLYLCSTETVWHLRQALATSKPRLLFSRGDRFPQLLILNSLQILRRCLPIQVWILFFYLILSLG